MPEISRFYGTIIAMFYDDHNPPYFHARYGSEKVIIDIDSLRILGGGFSPRALGLVIEWASQNEEELMNNWDLAKSSNNVVNIGLENTILLSLLPE
jgi:hypothetical protein